MGIDFSATLYDPIYTSGLGTDATLIINHTGGGSFPVRVIDKTKGAAVQMGRFGIETIVPCAYMRVSELAGLGFALTDLEGGQITVNGVTWKIKAYGSLPTPSGPGQVEMILVDHD